MRGVLKSEGWLFKIISDPHHPERKKTIKIKLAQLKPIRAFLKWLRWKGERTYLDLLFNCPPLEECYRMLAGAGFSLEKIKRHHEGGG